MKSKIKEISPQFVIQGYKKLKLSRLYFEDQKRFIKNYSSENYNSLNDAQLRSRIIFYSHAIEKGLSHSKLRYNFGERVLSNLHLTMNNYKQKNYNTNHIVWENSLSILREYKRVHESAQQDLTFFLHLFDDFIDEINSCQSTIGGAIEVKKNRDNNKNKNFKSLSQERVSIREFSDETLDMSSVNRAISLAMKSPSVCNRQSSRVRVLTNDEEIKTVLKVQAGFNGYKVPPVLLLVTSDIQSFLSEGERNQQYIDGGLYAMSLLYALEYEGIAACALNAMLGMDKERKIRETLNISNNESFIMFIAIGNYPDVIKIPKSFRLNSEDITIMR